MLFDPSLLPVLLWHLLLLIFPTGLLRALLFNIIVLLLLQLIPLLVLVFPVFGKRLTRLLMLLQGGGVEVVRRVKLQLPRHYRVVPCVAVIL